MKKKRNNSKRRSTIILSIIWAVVLFLCVFAVLPISFGIDEYNPPINSILLGKDLKGSVYAIFEAKMTDADDNPLPAEDLPALLEESLNIMKTRLRFYGYTEASVSTEGEYSIRVDIPNVYEAEDIFTALGKPMKIEICEVDPKGDTQNKKGAEVFSGSNIINASIGSEKGSPRVLLNLDNAGKDSLSAASKKAADGKTTLHIWIDDVYNSALTITERISDGVLKVPGFSSEDEAKVYAMQINSGTHNLLFETHKTYQTDPAAGEGVLQAVLIAGGVSIAVVVAVIFLFYRRLGFAGNLSLFIFIFLYIVVLATLPWIELTVPGIAGIAVAFALAAGCNFIIFEKIKDEYKSGKSIIAACDAGYKKSVFTILDSHAIALLASAAFWIFGSVFVRSFAATLFAGIVLSAFCSLVFNRYFIKKLLNINSTSPKKYNFSREANENE